jgi:C-1 hydroxylase
MHADEARAYAARLTDAWNRHDAEGVAACYAPDAVYEEMALGEPLQGRHTIRNAVQMYIDALPDIRLETRRVIAEEDWLCQEWTVTGTHLGDLLGLAPTSRRVEVPLCHVMTFGPDDLIHGDVFYWDALRLYRQLGALPALGPTGGLQEAVLSQEWG